jgi:hypothetical protein
LWECIYALHMEMSTFKTKNYSLFLIHHLWPRDRLRNMTSAMALTIAWLQWLIPMFVYYIKVVQSQFSWQFWVWLWRRYVATANDCF